MAYRIMQRISACRAPPGVRERFVPKIFTASEKMAVFPAQSPFL